MATALTLIQETARVMGKYRNGTSTSAGGNSTLIDASRRREEDDALQDAIAVLTDTGLANYGTSNWRRVNANVRSSGTLTITGTWATNPGATSTYDLYLPPFHPVYHLLPALNMALQEHFQAKPVYLQTRVRAPRGTTRITAPSTYRRVEAVLVSGSELLGNDDWRDGTGSWSLGGSHVLANTGDNQDRVLSVPNTNETTQDIGVTGGVDYDFSSGVENDGTRTTNMVIRWLASGSQIGSDITIGTSSATTHTRIGATQRSPVNATHVRVVLTASGAGTGRVYYASVIETRPWATAHTWDVRRDGNTRYIEFPHGLPASVDLLLRGEGVETTLSADTDNMNLDDNELRYVCLRAAEKAERMLMNDSGTETKATLERVAAWQRAAERVRAENAALRGVLLLRPRARGY